MEMTVEEISHIRDIDERFGGSGRQLPRVAKLAENLEKGLAYLLGMFSVVSSGENLSPFNRPEVGVTGQIPAAFAAS